MENRACSTVFDFVETSLGRHRFLKPAFKPTNKAFGQGSELFALLSPSLLFTSQAADETGRRLHLVSAALSVLQQGLMGREDRQISQ